MPSSHRESTGCEEDTPIAQLYQREKGGERGGADRAKKRPREKPLPAPPRVLHDAPFPASAKQNDLVLQSESADFSDRIVLSAKSMLQRHRRFHLFEPVPPGSADGPQHVHRRMLLPIALEQLLLQHQKEGVRFLLDRMVLNGQGALLADYMGLGKTIQVLAFCSLVLGTNELRLRCWTHIDKAAVMARCAADYEPATRPVAVPSLRHRPLRIAVVSPSGVTPQWVEEAQKLSDALFHAPMTFWSKGQGPALPTVHDTVRAHGFTRFEDSWLLDSASETLANLPSALAKNASWLFCIHGDCQKANKAVLLDVFRQCGGLLCISYSQILLEVCNGLTEVDIICLDEGHKIRNQNTNIANWMFSIRSPLRMIATGFPMQNRLNELYQLLHYVSSGAIGRTVLGSSTAFQRFFADPLQSAFGIGQPTKGFFDTNATGGCGVRSKGWVERRAAVFYAITKTYVLRRGLEVLRSLVGQQRNVFYVSLRPTMAQVKAYNKLKGEMMSPLDMLIMSSEVSSVHPSSWRPAYKRALGPLAENGEDQDDILHSCPLAPKMTFLWGAATALRRLGRRVIAFSQFHSVLDEVPKAFAQLSARAQAPPLAVARCDGTVPVDERVRICRRFNAPPRDGEASPQDDAPLDVLLFSLKAGCEGLNLIGGSMVISLDVSFNPACEHESFARAYRLGQSTLVDVVVLTMANSSEDDRLSLQDNKSRLADFCVDAKFASGAQHLSVESMSTPLDTHSTPQWWCNLPNLREEDSLEAAGDRLPGSAADWLLSGSIPMESYVAEVLMQHHAMVYNARCVSDADCSLLADERHSCSTLWAHHKAPAVAVDDVTRTTAHMLEVGFQELAYEKVHGMWAGVDPRDAHQVGGANDVFSSDESSCIAPRNEPSTPLTFFSTEGPTEERCDRVIGSSPPFTFRPLPISVDDDFSFEDVG